MGLSKGDILNLNFGRHANQWIPHNRIYALPRPVQRFLGYRSQPQVEPPQLVQCLLTFAATVTAICFVGAVFSYSPAIQRCHPPVLIASLGASAVLDYNAIRSPLAQPRNAILGNALSAVIGVAISKGFQRLESFDELKWLSAAFGCALSSLVMSITGTVHPPGGATAVIASVQEPVIDMGWIYVALILLSSVMMQFVALVFNNTLRQYPLFWWTSEDVGGKLRRKNNRDYDVDGEIGRFDALENGDVPPPESEADSEATLRKVLSHAVVAEGREVIVISPDHAHLPSCMTLTFEEMQLLESLQGKLQKSQVLDINCQ